MNWLKENQPERKFSILELNKLVDIAILEFSIKNDNFMEKLPASVIQRMIEKSKESGDLFKLNQMIKYFKNCK